MTTCICTLTFPDGEKLIGKIRARTLDAIAPVSFTGPARRLGKDYFVGAASGLEFIFRLSAAVHHAKLTVQKTGRALVTFGQKDAKVVKQPRQNRL